MFKNTFRSQYHSQKSSRRVRHMKGNGMDEYISYIANFSVSRAHRRGM